MVTTSYAVARNGRTAGKYTNCLSVSTLSRARKSGEKPYVSGDTTVHLDFVQGCLRRRSPITRAIRHLSVCCGAPIKLGQRPGDGGNPPADAPRRVRLRHRFVARPAAARSGRETGAAQRWRRGAAQGGPAEGPAEATAERSAVGSGWIGGGGFRTNPDVSPAGASRRRGARRARAGHRGLPRTRISGDPAGAVPAWPAGCGAPRRDRRPDAGCGSRRTSTTAGSRCTRHRRREPGWPSR